MGNALCRRRRRRIEIPRKFDEDDDHYRASVWGIWPDSVGEEDRDSLDASAGETAEERGIAATTTGDRSSGAKVRSDRPVPTLGGLVNEDGELTQKINHRSRAAWSCIRRFSRELFDRPRAPWRLEVRLLRAEAKEALLYECMTWAPRRDHYRLLRRHTDYSCELSGTAASAVLTDSFRTLRPSRGLGAKAWKLPFDNGDFCSREPWPGNPPGASRSG